MSLDNALATVRSTVPECVACSLVDMTTGMLLGVKTVDSHPQEVLDLVAAATGELFQGQTVSAIERTFKRLPVFDKAADRIVVHVVYDGPAFAGKTTNLEQLCGFFTEHRRSELFTTQNAGERTVYLDWLQLEGGVVAGRKLRCQMITVRGQTVLARRRWHLLKRADVVVFVLEATERGMDEARPMFEMVTGDRARRRENPQSPISIMLEHGVEQRIPESAPNASVASAPVSGREPPSAAPPVSQGLPSSPVASRSAPPSPPPAPPAHATLRAESPRAGVQSTPQNFVFEAGSWCLRTSPERWFASTDQARDALLALVRRKISLGPLLVSDTILTLQSDPQGGYWLWTVTPWLTTLEANCRENAAEPSRVESALGAYAAAVLTTLRYAVRREVLLALHPANFALARGNTYYVGDDIRQGNWPADFGTKVLEPIEDLAARPESTAGYLQELVMGLRAEFRDPETSERLQQAFNAAAVHTDIAKEARERLLQAVK